MHQQTYKILRFVADPAQDSFQDQARRLQVLVFELVYLNFLNCVHQAALLLKFAQLFDVFDVDHVDAVSRADGQQNAQIEQIVLFQLVD